MEKPTFELFNKSEEEARYFQKILAIDGVASAIKKSHDPSTNLDVFHVEIDEKELGKAKYSLSVYKKRVARKQTPASMLTMTIEDKEIQKLKPYLYWSIPILGLAFLFVVIIYSLIQDLSFTPEGYYDAQIYKASFVPGIQAKIIKVSVYLVILLSLGGKVLFRALKYIRHKAAN